MTTNPLITFKAGTCEIDQTARPYKVVPNPTAGYVYLYMEENLIHFCWRERSKPINHEDNLDLVMLPSDCRFLPYQPSTTSEPNTKTNGRIFILKFSSSFQRYAVWLQSKPEIVTNPSHFSERDLKIGRVVDKLLQGEDINMPAEIAEIKNIGGGGQNDEDEPMEDVEGHGNFQDQYEGGSGGAGSGATGGDFRREGSNAREGGADGGRAAISEPIDAASVVRSFLDAMRSEQYLPSQRTKPTEILSLHDLLSPSVTVPIIDLIEPPQIDKLLSHLPLDILLITQRTDRNFEAGIADATGKDEERCAAVIESLSLDSKRTILKRILRSPQFSQSLWSLTTAIRKGGLPNIAEALKIDVPNAGLMEGASVPLADSHALDAFMAGIKITVEKRS